MVWKAHEVVFRLRSPLHIGWSKVGNLLRTRPYVTGRVLWGALTMRLTRDEAGQKGVAAGPDKYEQFGKKVHRCLAFSYFYPALKSGPGDCYKVVWPWEDASSFCRRFLSSYQATALSYAAQSADEGMLREAEFIAPYTLDTAEEVFLKGYVFEKVGECTLEWKSALNRLQLGAERGYGWGDVRFVGSTEITQDQLFNDDRVEYINDSVRPIIRLREGARLPAHVLAENAPVAGNVEPLVGREWRSSNSHNRYVGQHVELSGVCFTPGSTLLTECDFEIKELGIWKALDN